MDKKTTRREFLGRAALTGAAIAGIPGIAASFQEATSRKGAKSRVVVVRDSGVMLDDGQLAQGAVGKLERMLGRSVAKLTNTSDATDGWKVLFSPEDVVAIKVNCISVPGQGRTTRPEVVQAVINSMIQAGVNEDNIIVYDRLTHELIRAGFAANRDKPGVKYYGIDEDWGDTIELGSFKGRVTKIITERTTAIVNMPILRTHGLAGISCCLKNHFGSFNNPSDYHDNHCDPAIADFNAIPAVKDKTRLAVIDATRPQYNDAKHDGLRNYCGLVVSRDPVAADACALDIMESKLEESSLESVAPKTRWLQSAEDRGVGVSDRRKIDLVRI